jgi:hypothetical protein
VQSPHHQSGRWLDSNVEAGHARLLRLGCKAIVGQVVQPAADW